MYNAVHGIGEANYEMVVLLLSAGADVRLGSEHGGTPLIETLHCFELRDGPAADKGYSRYVNCRKIVRLLLRSGVSLDGIDDAFRRLDPALGVGSGDYVPEPRHHYTMSRNLICDVRTAGGLRKYETMLRKQVLTLRTMALRGRAAPRDPAPAPRAPSTAASRPPCTPSAARLALSWRRGGAAGAASSLLYAPLLPVDDVGLAGRLVSLLVAPWAAGFAQSLGCPAGARGRRRSAFWTSSTLANKETRESASRTCATSPRA